MDAEKAKASLKFGSKFTGLSLRCSQEIAPAFFLLFNVLQVGCRALRLLEPLKASFRVRVGRVRLSHS